MTKGNLLSVKYLSENPIDRLNMAKVTLLKWPYFQLRLMKWKGEKENCG